MVLVFIFAVQYVNAVSCHQMNNFVGHVARSPILEDTTSFQFVTLNEVHLLRKCLYIYHYLDSYVCTYSVVANCRYNLRSQLVCCITYLVEPGTHMMWMLLQQLVNPQSSFGIYEQWSIMFLDNLFLCFGWEGYCFYLSSFLLMCFHPELENSPFFIMHHGQLSLKDTSFFLFLGITTLCLQIFHVCFATS